MYDSLPLLFFNFSRTLYLSRNKALTILLADDVLVRLRGRKVKPPPPIVISQYTRMGLVYGPIGRMLYIPLGALR